jgi:DNA-binding NtrC family response regulator
VLAHHFSREIGGAETTLPDALVARWEELPWPGNVRELRNAVSRHLALGDLVYDGDTRDEVDSARPGGDGDRTMPGDLTIPIEGMVERVLSSRLPLVQARQRIVEEFDRAYLARVLLEHEGNVTRAAAAAGLARRNFQILRGRRSV